MLATCNGGRLRNNFERLLAIPEDSWMMVRVKCESGGGGVWYGEEETCLTQFTEVSEYLVDFR